ncbi:fused MFS/spermidine synthase [Solicola sp. PLA-1-18]|uniref:fused MFS/spermidine synthase n=1 Tax=Solicola sp. PLA-1-18 TaxID=3380532 RepID=UPI003B78933A
MSQDPPRPAESLGPVAAHALVFGSSAAVLVVELVALRLLAPYLGLTLQTNTLVIGIALAAIAFGSWAGGRFADLVPPRRTLAPLLAVSGAVVVATPFLVRTTGELARGGDQTSVLGVAALTILVPGALLSAVTPMVTKLRLTTLDETGSVVGRLSGVGTTGAIVGTVLTGFVFVAAVPVTAILVALGIVLLVGAVAVGIGTRGWRGAVAPVVVTLIGATASALAPGDCDVETTYHCARVVADPERPSGRILELDTLRHSYVDLEDPTFLDFDYVQAVASLTDTAWPSGQALRAYHVGGGGLTLPRYLDEVRPGTRSLVSEIDAGVVGIDRDRLGLTTGEGIDVRVEDGRRGIERLTDTSRDLVVGDAFGGVAVPWHLTTQETARAVHRVLVDDGVYAVNLIDYGPMDFARAEVATLASVFDHVVVTANPDTLDGDRGGNVVVLASDRELDADALQARLDGRSTPYTVRTGAEVADFAGDARVLTDDFAPVDQLVTPYPPAGPAR